MTIPSAIPTAKLSADGNPITLEDRTLTLPAYAAAVLLPET